MLEGKAIKEAREREKQAQLENDSNQANLSGNVNKFTGETILPTKESENLTAIREQRLADTLSGKTSQMVEDAIHKKSTDSASRMTEEMSEEFDNKAEWTKCAIVEELDDDDDVDDESVKTSEKENSVSIDLNDIDIDESDDQNGLLLDGTNAKNSLSLLSALEQPSSTNGTDLFELD